MLEFKREIFIKKQKPKSTFKQVKMVLKKLYSYPVQINKQLPERRYSFFILLKIY